MRLCVVGPAHLHVRRWVGFFASRGHEVHLLTRGWDPPPDGVEVHELPRAPRRRGRLLWQARTVRRLLDRLAPDVVHAHWLVVNSWVLWLAGIRPVVLTPWGSDVFHLIPRNPAARLITFAALRAAALVTASSRTLLEATIRLGAHRDRCTVVRWGVDTSRFRAGPALRPLPGLPKTDGRTVVLNPRGPQRKYGPLLGMAAVRRVRQRRPDVLLVQVTDHRDPAHRDLAETAALDPDGVFLLERIAHAEMPQLLAAARIGLFLAATDSTSVSLLEAMAMGIVPVAADIPANRECLVHGYNGLLVSLVDPDDVARAILRALEDEALGARCRTVNPRWVRTHAEFRDHMARMEALYRAVAGAAGGAVRDDLVACAPDPVRVE